MSKQKKEKQPPVLGRLLEYAGGHKWLSVLGCGLSGVSAAAGIFPFVFVWYAARGILTPGGGVPAGLARYGWYALAAALLSAWLLSHSDAAHGEGRGEVGGRRSPTTTTAEASYCHMCETY